MTVLQSINSKSINSNQFVLHWITGQDVLRSGFPTEPSLAFWSHCRSTSRGHLWINSFTHLDHVTLSMFALLTVLNNILFKSLAQWAHLGQNRWCWWVFWAHLMSFVRQTKRSEVCARNPDFQSAGMISWLINNSDEILVYEVTFSLNSKDIRLTHGGV